MSGTKGGNDLISIACPVARYGRICWLTRPHSRDEAQVIVSLIEELHRAENLLHQIADALTKSFASEWPAPLASVSIVEQGRDKLIHKERLPDGTSVFHFRGHVIHGGGVRIFHRLVVTVCHVSEDEQDRRHSKLWSKLVLLECEHEEPATWSRFFGCGKTLNSSLIERVAYPFYRRLTEEHLSVELDHEQRSEIFIHALNTSEAEIRTLLRDINMGKILHIQVALRQAHFASFVAGVARLCGYRCEQHGEDLLILPPETEEEEVISTAWLSVPGLITDALYCRVATKNRIHAIGVDYAGPRDLRNPLRSPAFQSSSVVEEQTGRLF